MSELIFRNRPEKKDRKTVRQITESSGFFNSEEIGIADELICAALKCGTQSGYHFIFTETEGKVNGFSIYGPITGTKSSFDLYWIAVLDSIRGKGIGSTLLRETEKQISHLGGRRIYVETSSQSRYKPTHYFYQKHGYIETAIIPDFYDSGDSKIIFCKIL